MRLRSSFSQKYEVEVINTIKLFSEFLRSFDAWHVHNMMIIILDASTFCTLWKTLWNVGMQSSWHMNVMSRLSFLFWWCVLIGWTLLQMYLQLINWCYKIIFWRKYAWCGDFNWGSSQTLITKKLFLFRKLSIPSFACVDPLAWWCIQFLNVGFLVK